MEKFFLRGVFPGNKLNIIDQQDIYFAILLAESCGGLGADGMHQVVREFFGRNV